MQVGEVRAPEEADFERLRTLCVDHDGWKQVCILRVVALATLAS